MTINPEAGKQMLGALLRPWFDAVADPVAAQGGFYSTYYTTMRKRSMGKSMVRP